MGQNKAAIFSKRTAGWLLPFILAVAAIAFTPPAIQQGTTHSKALTEQLVSKKTPISKRIIGLFAKQQIPSNHYIFDPFWFTLHHNRIVATYLCVDCTYRSIIQVELSPMYARTSLSDSEHSFS